MSFRVRKPRIWDRLLNRFNLEDILGATFPDSRLSQTIVPVTDVDNLLKVSAIETILTPDDTSRSDVHTVPAGKRWTLVAMSASRGMTGTLSFGIAVDGVSMTIEEFTTSTKFTYETTSGLIVLQEADSINVTFNAGASGFLQSRVYIIEEDVF